MNKAQILEALLQLSEQERREVLQELRKRQDTTHAHARKVSAAPFPLRQRLQAAAESLREDYLCDPELTAFSALDGEEWDEAGRDLAD